MDQTLLRKPKSHSDTAANPSHVTFDDGKEMRRNLPWPHYAEARWGCAEPDTINLEIAQRYNLDRVYNGEISGWQSLEEPERSEHRLSPDQSVVGRRRTQKRAAGNPAARWREDYSLWSGFNSASRPKMNVCAWSASLATSGRSSRPKLSVS